MAKVKGPRKYKTKKKIGEMPPAMKPTKAPKGAPQHPLNSVFPAW